VRILIDDVEYPLPLDLTYREMNLMKRVSGLRAGELYEALDVSDPDAVIAFAAVAIRRANPEMSVKAIEDDLLDREFGKIILDFRVEGDELPLEPTATPAEPVAEQ
jgi:hypothetical protein